ncbi:MAG: hypothetical protein KatS3mg060_3136 [Dehalococcoidia bacterium]|nr:MAG: hypothetical protein KatS3mg060_3136 [Dehalococcoidia bacterium]
MNVSERIAERARRARRRRLISRAVLFVVLVPLVGCIPFWLLLGRVELSEQPGSAVGEIPVSTRPSIRFTGVSDGLRWLDVRARPAEARPATIRTTLIDEREPLRPVAVWTVTLTAPGPVWMEMPPVAQSAGVPYLVVVEPVDEDGPEVFLRLALDRDGQPVLAVQRFYRTSPVAWLVVMGFRAVEAGTLGAVLLAGGAFAALLAATVGIVVWRAGFPAAPGWTLAGLLSAAWGFAGIQALASARLWAQLKVNWPDGP